MVVKPKFNKAFWEWFGDSKVVDESGQPLVVYRGQKEYLGNYFKYLDYNLMPHKSRPNKFGFFFTDNHETANYYAKAGGNITEVYLKAINLLDLRPLGTHATEKQLFQFLGEKGFVIYKKKLSSISIPIWRYFDDYDDLKYDIRQNDYDGVIFYEGYVKGNNYIVFSPNQIKSATGNDGTWDIDDDSILSGSEEEISFKNLQEYGIYYGLLNEKMSNSFQKFINQNKYKYAILYHGTSAKHNIMEKGILPTSSKRRNSYQSSSGFVYLSNYPSTAKIYGEFAYPYDDIVVYKVRVPIKDLKPDLDNLKNHNIANPDEYVKPTLANSIIHGNSVRVARKIYPYEIIGVELLKRHNTGSSVVESETFNLFGIELFDKNLSGAEVKMSFDEFVDYALANKSYEKDFDFPVKIINEECLKYVLLKLGIVEVNRLVIGSQWIRHIIKSHSRDSETTNDQISITPLDIKKIPLFISEGIIESINFRTKKIKFRYEQKGYYFVGSMLIRNKEIRIKTLYKKREDTAHNVDIAIPLRITSKNVPLTPLKNNDDTKQNLLQDRLIDNTKRFYDIYEKANGKYADYFLVIENLLGLKLHYHYGDIVKVYQHNTTYQYVYLGFRKNPYNDSLEYYDHKVLSHDNSNTTTYSEKELTLVKKRNQVEELAQISYDEVNELIDKGYLENSWYNRDGGLNVINSLHRIGSKSFDNALDSFRTALDKKFIDEYNPKWINNGNLYLIQKVDFDQAILDYARINYLLNIKKINYEQSIKKVSEYLTNKIQ